jgi:hypothetical protein
MGVQQRSPTDAVRKGESSMIIGGKDRSYYRLASDDELIEEATYNPNTELCIALGERLVDITAKEEEPK